MLVEDEPRYRDMTLREHFALETLQSLLSKGKYVDEYIDEDSIVSTAVRIADKLLAELELAE